MANVIARMGYLSKGLRQRLYDGLTLILPDMPLFPEEAEEAMQTFRTLKLVDVPGHPTSRRRL